MRTPWLTLLIAVLPVSALAQNMVVTSLPRPSENAAVLQEPLPPPFIPAPDVPLGPPTAIDVFTRPERKFAFTMETQLLFPAIHQHLSAPITVPGFYNDIAHLPSADQDLAGAFLFNLRTKAFGGEIGVTYRLLASEGRGFLDGFDPNGPADFRSRLDMHQIDLDYSTRSWVFGPSSIAGRTANSATDFLCWLNGTSAPLWTVQFDLGARLASIYFDSQASGDMFDRHITNYFFGAGPHVGLHLARNLGTSRFAIIGRLDAGAVFGGVHQQFRDMVFDNTSTLIGFGYTDRHQAQAIPVLIAEIGLGARPGPSAWGQWQIGYQFEQWWALGGGSGSNSDIINQGFFARWIISY
jgi:hypothetical protein